MIEGGSGTDQMLFNGSNASEKFAATATGSRLRLTRDIGAIVMDTDTVERVVLNTLGGADATIGDLKGTDIRDVDVDLGAQTDGVVDSVTLTGSAGKDSFGISGANGTVTVDGRPDVRITHAESTDQLTVDTQAGDDTVDSRKLAPGTITLTVL